MVWRWCLNLDEWSHRDSPTEATSTHIDEASSQCDIAFIHTVSVSREKASCKRMFALHFSSSSILHTTHTSLLTPTYLLIYHLHAHIHVLRILPTGLVIAARLFCIHTRESRHSLFLSLFLSYEYKIIKTESKETWKIFSIPLFPISSPRGDSSDTWLNYFISLRGGQV